jgi:hypothetical protein
MSVDPASLEARIKLVDDPRTTTGKVTAAITPPFAVVRKLGERFLERLKSH